MLTVWIFVFILSLTLLIKSSSWLLESAEKIGFKIGLPPIVIGVTIVGFGTSLPELVSSVFAVLQDESEIVAANVIGSNIANILLILASSAIVSKKITFPNKTNKIDLLFLLLSTFLFILFIKNGWVGGLESLSLLFLYVAYMFLILFFKGEAQENSTEDGKISIYTTIFLFIGIIGLAVGAKYLVDSIINISNILNVSPGIVSATVVALGTSLPELIVSIKASMQNKFEVAIGNIFGSNIFNILVVAGLPGILTGLRVGEESLGVGIIFLIIATFLFVVSIILKKITRFHGFIYLIFYTLFILQTIGIN